MEVTKQINTSIGGNLNYSPDNNRGDVVMLEEDQQIDTYDETKLNPNGFFAETKVAACSVRVALRVRPLIGRELYESPQICVSCRPQDNQLIIGKDRTFTFDQVFDIGTQQEDVFEICVKNLVLGCFQGYNATVLAYGQTGSGKTFTMGSGYTIGLRDHELGIIPRVIRLIFDEVEKRKRKAEFIIKCTFLEIYNEELNDLLDHSGISANNGAAAVIDRYMSKKDITIREEKNGNISVYGLKEEKVETYEELAACLDRGSNQRSVASTLMNNTSSRSHAIFTISIEQHIIEDLYKADGVPQPTQTDAAAEEFMVAKFHFVDLAGSERAKRTGATGATLKEGISINKGLLALGNVISALTEEGKKGHVPYRDSKLTRILQDSLGGNSRTSMIACVSPAEINFEETLNTLKYASRARNIKNKPIVNRDPNSAQIAQLRQQIYELQRELGSCRKLLTTNNIAYESTLVIPDGIENSEGPAPTTNKMEFMLGAQEIQKYEQEIKELKVDRSSKDKKLASLQVQFEALKEQTESNQLEMFSIQKERDIARFQLEQITQVLKKREIFGDIMNEIHGYNLTERMENMDLEDGGNKAQKENYDYFFGSSGPCILEEYQVKVEEQKKELGDKNQLIKTLQKDYELLHNQTSSDMKLLEEKEKEIERLKRSVNKLQKENIQIKNDQRKGSRAGAMPLAPQMTNHRKQPSVAQQPPQKSMNTFAAALKKKEQQEQKQQWLPTELDYNIKHFNEMFIENLSQSLSNVLVKRPGTAPESQRTLKEEDKQSSDKPDTQGTDSLPNAKPEDLQDSSSDTSSADELEQQDQTITNEQEVLEALQNNEEIKQVDAEVQQQLQAQEQQINYIEGDLQDKESLLKAIKDSHNMLQNNLLEAMKNEYHKKIQQLDNEMRMMEKEKNESMKKAENPMQKSKLEDQYKKKMKELEDQLNGLKQKDREQNTMVKQAQQQKLKIKALEGEIEKMKTQKVSLMRKIKEETDKHRKWKEDRAKELMRIKQANIKKDKEIDKLKRENKRKEILAKRKQEELSALQKKTKIDKQKQINAKKDRNKKKGIDVEKIQEWIMNNTEKMLKNQELQQALSQEQEICRQVEQAIVEEQSQHAVLMVKKEKLVILKAQVEANDEEELYQINEQIDEIDIELKTIQDNIESLEEKLDFINLKITNYNSELIGLSPDDIDQLDFSEVKSIEGAQACLGAFFSILLGVNVYKKQLEAQLLHQEAMLEELRLQIEEANKNCMASEINFQKELELATQSHQEKETILLRILADNCGLDIEQLIGGEAQKPDQIRELLRSKENELAGDSQPTLQSQLTQLTKKAQQIKQEVKKNKDQQYAQSKTALSKRVAELERQKREDDKKLESMRHKYESMNQEKDLFKRQLDQIKQKMKTQEIEQIKNQKQLAIEDPNMSNNYNSQQKSPRFVPGLPPASKLNSLSDIRKERKIKKLGSAPVAPLTAKNYEPRVIVDEPMEEESSSTSPQKKPAEERKISIPQLDMTAIDANPSKVFEPASTKNQPTSDEFNVFTRLSQGRRPTINSNSFSLTQQPQPQAQQQAEQIINQGFDDDHKWKCIINKELAHAGQVCALASVGNQLYSTSNKSLKIWDLDTMSCISDIQAHNTFIKCVEIWEEKKLLLTASDKVIMLWDLISLTNVGQLKGHRDEIKALNVTQDGSLLFSAGKGSSNGGALLLWDLRKGAAAIEEREKNQDIFSLASQGDQLFMGCRNHYVYPFNIRTFETIQPFEPPHFDAVTSLSILDNTLVSGSRDKNLRCWDFSNPTNKYSDVMQAHSDWINTLATDYDKRELYSGSKDGIVKVWKIKNKKLKCMASLSSGSSSVNSICNIDKQFGKMFVQGCSDKSIRMWKFKDKFLNNNENSPSSEFEEQMPMDAHMDQQEDSQEIEHQLFGQLERKEETKKDESFSQQQQKYQPVRSQVQSQPVSKLQQMRRQKKMQDSQKRQQKENDIFQK